jgi:hypothetical protein
MNGFGEPNMGNPSVRFDEGRRGSWSLACGLSIQHLPPTLPNKAKNKFHDTKRQNRTAAATHPRAEKDDEQAAARKKEIEAVTNPKAGGLSPEALEKIEKELNLL